MTLFLIMSRRSPSEAALGGTVIAARTSADDWLVRHYWRAAMAIFGVGVVVAIALGDSADMYGVGVFGGITLVARLVAGRRPALGVRGHLLALIPYWTWYADLASGLPSRLGGAVAGHAVLVIFPVVALVALEGRRGAALALVLAAAAAVWRFGVGEDALLDLFLVSVGAVNGLVFRRLASSLEQANRSLHRIAQHDPTTDLVNRRGFEARCAARRTTRGAVLFVDLARFKAVNDVFGHRVGDEVLRRAARRLEATTNAHFDASRTTIARIGGDEFALALDSATAEEALALGRALGEAMRPELEIAGHVLHVGCTTGIALIPEHGEDASTLLSRADAAMYSARAAGETALVYAPAQESHRRVERELVLALERDELEVHYQPVCELDSGAIVGVEALVRWRHPARGLLLPAAFIDCAEATGLVAQVDRLVLEKALAQLAAWRRDGKAIWVAVNVSARTLEDAGFCDAVESLVEAKRLPAGSLVIEVTESVAMRRPDASAAVLERLAALGVETALDDFGMGYSSLAYLKRLPATHLKLDRVFVAGIGESERDEGVVELLLDLGRKFGMQVVAEGVETEAQLAWLAARGCRYVQGFLLAKPQEAAVVFESSRPISGVYPRDRRPLGDVASSGQ